MEEPACGNGLECQPMGGGEGFVHKTSIPLLLRGVLFNYLLQMPVSHS
jgi:hypothetical protein